MKKLVLIFLMINHVNIFAQFCTYDHVINNKKSLANNYNIIYDMALNRLSNNAETYYIPVVFHVVYNTESQNIADSVIHSQIDVLNEDYRRLNENASETRDEFIEFAGDANIEFFLANVDPDGNATNGIIHKYTERDEFPMIDFFSPQDIALDQVKSSSTGGSDAWDTNKYLNIWVCNIAPFSLDQTILDLLDFDGDGEPDLDFDGDGEPDVNLEDFEDGGQVFGYAYPPINVDDALLELSNTQTVPDWPTEMLSSDESLQGVVIHYTTVGRNNPVANEDNMTENNKGRTAVHEIGHYLGLRHTWGDAVGGDGCGVDDGISDTPNANNNAGYICDLNKNTCQGDMFGSSNEDLPDMVENYMDYSPDACMNIFTNGQINVMRNVLEIARNELINTESSLNIDKMTSHGHNPILIKKTDILGREHTNSYFNIEIYSDGSVKKLYNLK